MRGLKCILIGFLVFLFVQACAVKKYIPEDELLYEGAKIDMKDSLSSKDRKKLRADLEDGLFPEPNSRFLGLYPGLHFYYAGKQENAGFINRFLSTKMGQKPVYYSAVDREATEEIFDNRLENNGFFFGDIESEVTKNEKKKTASVKYTVTPGVPYRIRSVQFDRDSLERDTIALMDHIEKVLKNEESVLNTESLLKADNRFSLEDFKAERGRIDDELKEKGYYYFSDKFLLFEADTNRYRDKGFDVYLKLKEETPEKAKVPYVIDSVQVYANVINDTVYGVQDTVRVDGVDIIQSQRRRAFKPQRLRPFVLLEPGKLYSPQASRYTSRRLSGIGNYKFVNIYYTEADTMTDDLGRRHLKSVITLSPLPRNTVQLRFQGVTKSNDFAGPGIGVTYVNRNIFNGGENLNVDTDFGYEKQFSGESKGTQSISWGVKGSLIFPRLLFPWKFHNVFLYSIPKTRVSVGFDYLDRSRLYSLINWSSAFGYIWEQNRFVTHTFDLLKIDYVKLSHTSERFEKILDENRFLRRSFEQQFIAGFNYSFTFSELNETDQQGKLYFQFNTDIAGNVPDLFSKMGGDDSKTFLGLKYAQYVKADVDLSYHQDLNRTGDQKLVGHVFAGYGWPYGNSQSLPFVKQYFAGGPYSIRAFNIRSLGPGTYKPPTKNDSYFDQAGDIRLEANIEYRFPIVSYLKGALFFDAGNVWLRNENEALPGGKFTSHFYKELGMGAGFGARVDIQGFVLRFDLASPLKRPAENWNFEYRKPVFNFAIGYPF